MFSYSFSLKVLWPALLYLKKNANLRAKQSMPLSNNTLDPNKSKFSVLHAFETLRDQPLIALTNAANTSIPK